MKLKDIGAYALTSALAAFIVYVVASHFAGDYVGIPLAFLVYVMLMTRHIRRQP